MLQTHYISQFTTVSGYKQDLPVTYQIFGAALGTAPVVLVNHALTGNSSVTGEQGWWNHLIGPDKAIDTNYYTILAIDIPGNGHNEELGHLITKYKEFTNRDIVGAQLAIFEHLKIDKLFAVIGGSLGGQIAWELAIQKPNFISHLIPVATDWKATDWVIAQCHIQDSLLNNSCKPIEDARMHAMTFYRTPASFKNKFNRTQRDVNLYNTQSWLYHHGKRLSERFSLWSYKLMNHLLLSADVTLDKGDFSTVAQNIKAQVHQVAIDTDGLFLANEIYETHLVLQELGVSSTYHEIISIHGHDAFLIEYAQLSAIIKPVFQKEICHK